MSDADEFFNSVPTGAIEEDGVPRDGLKRYLLPDPVTGEVYGHTRVTTVANTMDTGFGLGPWRENCIARGYAMRPDLLAQAGAADPEDEHYNRLMKQVNAAAFEAGGGNHGSNLGTAQHKAFERYFFKGEPLANLPEFFHADIRAVEAELQAKGVQLITKYIERTIRCDVYGRGGRIDGVAALPDGTNAIIDLKTEKDPVKYPEGKTIQLAFYANANWIMNYETQQYEPMPSVRKDFALVIWCRPGSGVAELLTVPVDLGWMGARVAEEVRAWKQQKIVVAPYIPNVNWAPPVISRPGKQADVYAAAMPTPVHQEQAVVIEQPATLTPVCDTCREVICPTCQQCCSAQCPRTACQCQQIPGTNTWTPTGGNGLSTQVGQIVGQALQNGSVGPAEVAQLNQQAAELVQQNGQHPSSMAAAGLPPAPAQPPGQPVVGPGTAHPVPQQQPLPVPSERPPAPKASASSSPADLYRELLTRTNPGVDPEVFHMEMCEELAALPKRDVLQPLLRLIDPKIDESDLKRHRGPLAEMIVDRVIQQHEIRAREGAPVAQQAPVQAAPVAQQPTVQPAQPTPAAPWGQPPVNNGFVDMTYESVMVAIAECPNVERLGAIYQQWVGVYGPQNWTGAVLDAANAKLAQLQQLQPTH